MAVTTTGQALRRVVGEQQFHDGLAGIDDTRGVGMHHHSLHTLLLARGGEVATSFHLHHADTAGTGVVLKM